MAKDDVITVLVPAVLKRTLLTRARAEKRSLSAQIATYLERDVQGEANVQVRSAGRLLGLFVGSPVPSEEGFAEARRLLWGSLGRRK